MTHYFIIPGLGNSGPEHWQTYFEKTLPNAQRIQQKEWDAPDCADWLEAIEAAVQGYDLTQVVLIAHSLGCATVAHWAKRYGHKIKGAFLVAPSDIEQPVYTFPSTGFTPIPLEPLGFKSIVVASSNDEWVDLERARFFATHWGSEFINIGDAGHINAQSGYGDWKEGLEILERLG
ncbi:RBBP9/YdeN family alpha/beta hydrolase [Haliscomenobacter sp.]|uniref:RBBP9/YdeN family alpha/beta hydrolase n=1 Tax=Haliscomenobacter sp. TaxID=2717303 RepID=UPI003BABD4EC